MEKNGVPGSWHCSQFLKDKAGLPRWREEREGHGKGHGGGPLLPPPPGAEQSFPECPRADTGLEGGGGLTPRGGSWCSRIGEGGWARTPWTGHLFLNPSGAFFAVSRSDVHCFVSSLRGPEPPWPPLPLDCCYLKTSWSRPEKGVIGCLRDERGQFPTPGLPSLLRGQQNPPCGSANYRHRGGPLSQTGDVTAPLPGVSWGHCCSPTGPGAARVSLGKWLQTEGQKPPPPGKGAELTLLCLGMCPL